MGAHKDCSGDTSCCPDGLDCVTSAANKSTCEWTGSPVIPPASYKAEVKVAGRRLHSSAAADDITASELGFTRQQQAAGRSAVQGRKMLQQLNACANSTLPAGCSRSGPRAQLASGTCVDVPLPVMMSATPPALDVTSSGQWVVKGTATPAQIRGINWFGFNVGQTMVDGLWAGYTNATVGDFPTVLKRIKLLGFNGLRLPFTFAGLDAAPKTSLYVTGCKADTTTQFRAAVTPPPSYTTPTTSLPDSAYLSAASCPFTTAPTATKAGALATANMHVPGKQDSSTWNRFFWVVQYAVGQGFYVVADFHFEQSGLQNNATLFASEWRRFWRDFVRLPYYGQHLQGRVFPELANEWDKFGCKWDTTSTGCASTYATAMSKAAAAIKEESLAVGQPVPVILIEGVGQLGLGLNWGDGFATDSAVISPSSGVSDARPHFRADLASSVGYRMALAPHAYGPSVTGETVPSQTYGSALWARLTKSWGSKSSCATWTTSGAGINQFYPLAPTEFGSDCDTFANPGCPDFNYLRDYALYTNGARGAAGYLHTASSVWFWWCWNANSGDTGGMVAATPAIRYAIKWYKVRYLEAVGLCPWWKSCSYKKWAAARSSGSEVERRRG